MDVATTHAPNGSNPAKNLIQCWIFWANCYLEIMILKISMINPLVNN